MGASKLQKSWQFYASGYISFQDIFLISNISDPSWTVDLRKVWARGVYPPWEAELHFWIHGGLLKHFFFWEKIIKMDGVNQAK